MQSTIRAFHGSKKLKSKYLTRVRRHRKADDIISGIYWEKTGERMKGCAVGCTLHSSDHGAYETELGIPRVLAKLEDRLFEGLWATGQVEIAKEWPERFLSAPKVGSDLSMVWPKFAHWILIDPEHGVLRVAKKEHTRKVISDGAALFARWIAGDKPPSGEFKHAAAAADAYAGTAAGTAAAAYAGTAAGTAAAAYAAAYAAADAATAARGKYYSAMCDKLIELMEGAK